MASNKFFTWTKGDRKHAVSDPVQSIGMVPIPAECISTKGLDYRRRGTIASNRSTLPSSFSAASDATPTRSSRRTGSLALHDAAVQSATSLMTIMNDMLRSPQLATHLSAQQRADLGPVPGRTRALTAPPTPVAEAPTIKSPAELPGSFPSDRNRQSQDSSPFRPDSSVSNMSPVGNSIPRPHSSPKEKTIGFGIRPCTPPDSVCRSTPKLDPPTEHISQAQMGSPYIGSGLPLSPSSSQYNETPRMQYRELNHTPTPRPTSTMPRESGPQTSIVSSLLPRSQPSSVCGSAYPSSSVFDHRFASDEQIQCLESEAALMDQITLMRSEHEAHVKSLRDAHAREIASHQSYVAFLEKRRGTRPLHHITSRSHLTIDTSKAAGRYEGPLSSEASASGSHQSFESSLESHKRASAEVFAETEALKRKLSLCRKTQANLGDIRQERDLLRDAAERNDRRIAQLKEIGRKAKEKEKALRNTVESLEARLADANSERIDVLEGYHEACQRVQTLVDQEAVLVKQRDELRIRLSAFDPGAAELQGQTEANVLNQTEPQELDTKRATLRSDPLLQQLDQMSQAVAERDTRIKQLEKELSEAVATEQKQSAPPVGISPLAITQLQEQLRKTERKLLQAEYDRDQYNSLLHTELLRQVRNVGPKGHAPTPQIEAEAFAMTEDKLKSLRSTSSDGQSYDPELGNTHEKLSNELQHCIKEIIMYKLDVKRYKKDLKQALAKVHNLQTIGAQGIHTPDSQHKHESYTRHRSQDLATASFQSHDKSGLGISVPAVPPKTPPKNVSSATMSALLSMDSTPPPPSSSMSTPSRPKTPLGTHKKLPKPPPRSDSPLQTYLTPPPSTQRIEANRSLSESVVSSYAQREKFEVNDNDTVNSHRGRSVPPPKVAPSRQSAPSGA